MPDHHELRAIAKSLVAVDGFPGIGVTSCDTTVLAGAWVDRIKIEGFTQHGTMYIVEKPPGELDSFYFVPDATKP